MHHPDRSRIRVDISFIKGVWQVIVFVGEHSEHRSFQTELEAREYGAARLEQLKSGKVKDKHDGR